MYEYEVRFIKRNTIERVILDQMANAGWRLVAVLGSEYGHSLYFERIKQEME